MKFLIIDCMFVIHDMEHLNKQLKLNFNITCEINNDEPEVQNIEVTEINIKIKKKLLKRKLNQKLKKKKLKMKKSKKKLKQKLNQDQKQQLKDKENDGKV